MFGKRDATTIQRPAPAAAPPVQTPAPAAEQSAARPPAPAKPAASQPKSAPPAAQKPAQKPQKPAERSLPKAARTSGPSEQYYAIKTTIFNALIDTIDLGALAQLDAETAAEEIRDIVTEIISIKNVAMSIAEQEQLLQDICNS